MVSMPETPPTAAQLDADGYAWPKLDPRATLLSDAGDPVVVFAKLVREVEAGQVLVSLASSPGETKRAALDALQLARDVLTDGLEAVSS
jgi:hypothetical protein